jgi:hypothetical protein
VEGPLLARGHFVRESSPGEEEADDGLLAIFCCVVEGAIRTEEDVHSLDVGAPVEEETDALRLPRRGRVVEGRAAPLVPRVDDGALRPQQHAYAPHSAHAGRVHQPRAVQFAVYRVPRRGEELLVAGEAGAEEGQAPRLVTVARERDDASDVLELGEEAADGHEAEGGGGGLGRGRRGEVQGGGRGNASACRVRRRERRASACRWPCVGCV